MRCCVAFGAIGVNQSIKSRRDLMTADLQSILQKQKAAFTAAMPESMAVPSDCAADR
jgi:hypothetical protein